MAPVLDWNDPAGHGWQVMSSVVKLPAWHVTFVGEGVGLLDGFAELGLEEGTLEGAGDSRTSISGGFREAKSLTDTASMAALPSCSALAYIESHSIVDKFKKTQNRCILKLNSYSVHYLQN